jgi:hypothetical protein
MKENSKTPNPDRAPHSLLERKLTSSIQRRALHSQSRIHHTSMSWPRCHTIRRSHFLLPLPLQLRNHSDDVDDNAHDEACLGGTGQGKEDDEGGDEAVELHLGEVLDVAWLSRVDCSVIEAKREISIVQTAFCHGGRLGVRSRQ